MQPHVADFLAHLRDVRGVSPHTSRNYGLDLNQFAGWLLENKLLKPGQGPEKVTYLAISPSGAIWLT